MVAVLFDNTNDYSIGLSDAFQAKAAALGMEVVAAESAVAGDADYTPQLTKIAEAAPEAVFICYYYQDAALMLRQAVDVGLDATMMGADGWGSIEQQLTDAPELLDKAVYCDSFSPDDDSPAARPLSRRSPRSTATRRPALTPWAMTPPRSCSPPSTPPAPPTRRPSSRS
jgi:branched-chain amino acid transport system substrate-binding protein